MPSAQCTRLRSASKKNGKNGSGPLRPVSLTLSNASVASSCAKLPTSWTTCRRASYAHVKTWTISSNLHKSSSPKAPSNKCLNWRRNFYVFHSYCARCWLDVRLRPLFVTALAPRWLHSWLHLGPCGFQRLLVCMNSNLVVMPLISCSTFEKIVGQTYVYAHYS